MPNQDKQELSTEVSDLPPTTDELARLTEELANCVALLSEKHSEATALLLASLCSVTGDIRFIRENLCHIQTKVERLSGRIDDIGSKVLTKH